MTTGKHAPLRALVLLTFLALSALDAAADEVETWFLNSLAKSLPARPDDSFLARFASTGVIHAAWGEREALQILVLAPPEGLKDLRVVVSDFAHESGDVWEPGTVSAAFVGYVTTQAPYYGTLHVGEWPDPILPDAAVDVAPGRAQPIWVEAAVPLDAEAGRYTGTITLTAVGWRKELPLEVEAWGFDLPEHPTLPSSFLLRARYIHEYHSLERATPAAESMVRRYHESMLAHRIMPTHVATDEVNTRPRLSIAEDGTLRRADFAAYDAKIEWAMARGQTHFGLEGSRKLTPHTETYYRAIADHLRERGWIDRFYTYLVDETYEGVNEITGMVHRAAPDLKNLITRLPSLDHPDVDWWCPRLGDAEMHRGDVKSLQSDAVSRAAVQWVYTAGNAGSDVPALHLDVPGIEARITPLAVWKGGYEGLLFWCVNYWTVDPWRDPMVYPRQNGNGSLYYPGADGPVESIRLKMLRDGFDDVDYAALLQGSHDDLARRILAALPLRNPLDWQREPAALTAWRLAAGYYLAGNTRLAASWVGELEGQQKRGQGGEFAILSGDRPGKGWHGGKDGGEHLDRRGRRSYRFTLDGDKSKLWRIANPGDWRPYRELRLKVKMIEGEPVRLNLKLGSGIFRRKSWSWEIHCPPGVERTVRIPIPHERVDTSSLKELSLFLWEPESPRRFELSGAWLR